MIPQLVPRSELGSATRLDQVSVNAGRAIGPAIAGVVIATWGVPWVFALVGLCAVPLALALLLWRRPLAAAATPERFLPAMRAGGLYAWYDPAVRRIFIRIALFVAPGTALWPCCPSSPCNVSGSTPEGTARCSRPWGSAPSSARSSSARSALAPRPTAPC